MTARSVLIAITMSLLATHRVVVGSAYRTQSLFPCACGGPQAYWGTPAAGQAVGLGELMLSLNGEAYLEIRDPVGRWIRCNFPDGSYRSDIPSALIYPEDDIGDDTDTSAVAESTEVSPHTPTRTQVELPGPLSGSYLLRVHSSPRALWFLTCEARGGREQTSGAFFDSRTYPDSSTSFRLTFDVADTICMRAGAVSARDSAMTESPTAARLLPCEAEDTRADPSEDIRIEAFGPGSPQAMVTTADGKNHDVYRTRSAAVDPGGLASTETLAYWGTARPAKDLQIRLSASSTGIHRIVATCSRQGKVLSILSDTATVRAGDDHYWHTTWSDHGPSRAAGPLLVPGPVRLPPVLECTSEFLCQGREPALSPDGHWLAFVRADGLWKLEVQSKNTSRIVACRNAHWPVWTTDGRRLIFEGDDPSRTASSPVLLSVTSDGGSARALLVRSGLPERYPLLSPDGRRIVWTRGSRLWISDLSGAHARTLTSPPARVFERACEWSPVSRSITYVASDGACDGPQYRVRRIRLDGTRLSAGDRELRAEHIQSIPGSNVRLASTGRTLFIPATGESQEPIQLLLAYPASGAKRSRFAIASDGKSGIAEVDPFPDGDAALFRFTLPGLEDPRLIKRWRHALDLLGADSTTVLSTWGAPSETSIQSSGLRAWAYKVHDGADQEFGTLQFYFLGGKLWSVSRGAKTLRGFANFP